MATRKDLKVLVVDDSITVRELMKQQLRENGIQNLDEAKNGKEAVVKFQSFRPDLIFLDINMPEMNGVEVLTKVLEIDPKAHVIMLSSLGTKEKINETLQRGAKNFLMKPIENENLERILSELTK
jgi:two-component system, chemotaxis family, chemotaxis protein CheY